jgi:hypothetical protein
MALAALSSQESQSNTARGETESQQAGTPLVSRRPATAWFSLRRKLDHPRETRLRTHPIPIAVATTPDFFEWRNLITRE